MSTTPPTAPAMRLREPVLVQVLSAVKAAVGRLNFSVSPRQNIEKFRAYRWSRLDKLKYGTMFVIALFSVAVMGSPSFPSKLLIPAIYIAALLIPLTSQLILPASPILLWLLLFYSCRFIDVSARPHIWVSVLPTLETIWYGASISDILTRFGHPLLDVLAWIPYGVVHFAAPFIVAILLFVFAPESSVKMFGSAFGLMNLTGVLIQIAFPCAPPWYELREGLTPANYGMRGSPAGLARIDALFGGFVYTMGFSSAPVVFGAFPSLHAACATCEALFLSYFFPIKLPLGRWRLDTRIFYWLYAFWLYWSTMYLMHHYLIDLVAGGCLATMAFYLCRPESLREAMEDRVAAMEREERARLGEPVDDALPLERFPFKPEEQNPSPNDAIFAIDEESMPHDAASHS